MESRITTTIDKRFAENRRVDLFVMIGIFAPKSGLRQKMSKYEIAKRVMQLSKELTMEELMNADASRLYISSDPHAPHGRFEPAQGNKPAITEHPPLSGLPISIWEEEGDMYVKWVGTSDDALRWARGEATALSLGDACYIHKDAKGRIVENRELFHIALLPRTEPPYWKDARVVRAYPLYPLECSKRVMSEFYEATNNAAFKIGDVRNKKKIADMVRKVVGELDSRGRKGSGRPICLRTFHQRSVTASTFFSLEMAAPPSTTNAAVVPPPAAADAAPPPAQAAAPGATTTAPTTTTTTTDSAPAASTTPATTTGSPPASADHSTAAAATTTGTPAYVAKELVNADTDASNTDDLIEKVGLIMSAGAGIPDAADAFSEQMATLEAALGVLNQDPTSDLEGVKRAISAKLDVFKEAAEKKEAEKKEAEKKEAEKAAAADAAKATDATAVAQTTAAEEAGEKKKPLPAAAGGNEKVEITPDMMKAIANSMLRQRDARAAFARTSATGQSCSAETSRAMDAAVTSVFVGRSSNTMSADTMLATYLKSTSDFLDDMMTFAESVPSAVPTPSPTSAAQAKRWASAVSPRQTSSKWTSVLGHSESSAPATTGKRSISTNDRSPLASKSQKQTNRDKIKNYVSQVMGGK